MDVCNSASKEQKAIKDEAIGLSVRGRIPLNISGLTVEILIFGEILTQISCQANVHILMLIHVHLSI